MSASNDIDNIDAVLAGLTRVIQKQLTDDKETLKYFALLHIAKAIHRLAATQEKPVTTQSKAVHFTQANYAETPDIQTQELREEARKRSGDRSED